MTADDESTEDESGENFPATYDEQGNALVPTPKKIDLRNAEAIRRELASVYRDMRSGRIETQDGTRLGYMLDLLGKAYERSVLEERIAQLELMTKG